MYIGPVNSNNFNFNILKQDMQQFLEDQTAFFFPIYVEQNTKYILGETTVRHVNSVYFPQNRNSE